MLNSMSITRPITGWLVGVLFLALAAIGCENEPAKPADPKKATGDPPARKDAPPADTARAAEAKKAPLGKNVWLETQGDRRRVIVSASVCLREGEYGLECLMCRKNTKEHES